MIRYDLDIYMIVAVDDFNMGAMENKGLNVFNSKYVLASEATATDTDYENIQGVVGHGWTLCSPYIHLPRIFPQLVGK